MGKGIEACPNTHRQPDEVRTYVSLNQTTLSNGSPSSVPFSIVSTASRTNPAYNVNSRPNLTSEEITMGHYITLIRYTQQGAAKIKESPARLDAAKKAAEAVGGKIHAGT
jgi:hypothetical protein